jgi:hypothetical protein
MTDYLMPVLFLVVGVAAWSRAAWLRSRAQAVPALLSVAGAFAAGVGGFLLALVIMCNP